MKFYFGCNIKLRKQKKIPAYAVFADSTIKEFAVQLPASEYQMLLIPGVSEKKFNLYGIDFLKVIMDYRAEHNMQAEFSLKDFLK